MATEQLSETAVSELAAKIERIAGGPSGPGVHYIMDALGELALTYGPLHPGFSDVGRLVAMLARGRVSAELTRAAFREGHG